MVTSHFFTRSFCFLVLSFFLTSYLLVYSSSVYSEIIPHCRIFNWENFPDNTWVKLDTCGDPPRKVFHGAASLGVDRNEVFFFGADTHEVDFDNSVTRFHVKTLKWTKDYEPDPVNSYKITPRGFPMTIHGRPWAMHAFDTFDYHPPSRRFLFVGFPDHARLPKRALQYKGTNLNELRPATWWYDPDKKQWELLSIPSPNLFAHGLVWASENDQFIGHDGSSTFHFDPKQMTWKTYQSPSIPGWHQRLVWKTETGQILSLGNNFGISDLWTYSLSHQKWKRIMVKETPLPANGAAMAYDTGQNVLLYLANDYPNAYNNPSGKSVTFLYHSATQSWARLNIESPPLYGMNFLTQYDPIRKVFLHFEKTSQSDEKLAVWALRWKKTKTK